MDIYIVQSISFSLVCMFSLSFLSYLCLSHFLSNFFTRFLQSTSWFLSIISIEHCPRFDNIYVAYSAWERLGSSLDTANRVFLLSREEWTDREIHANPSFDPNVSFHSHHFRTELIRHDVLVASFVNNISWSIHYTIFLL